MERVNVESEDFLRKVNEIVIRSAKEHNVKPEEVFIELCDRFAEHGFKVKTYKNLTKEIDNVAEELQK